MIIVDNDEAMNICKMCYDIRNPTFDDLNGVISSSLISVFLPVNLAFNLVTSNRMQRNVQLEI